MKYGKLCITPQCSRVPAQGIFRTRGLQNQTHALCENKRHGAWHCYENKVSIFIALWIGRFTEKEYKVSRAIDFSKHAGNSPPQDTLKTLCTGIVEQHVRYCCSVCCYCGKTELNQLQILQNPNSSYDAPSMPLLHRHKWKSIQELFADETKMFLLILSMILDQDTCIKCSPEIHISLSAFFETLPLI